MVWFSDEGGRVTVTDRCDFVVNGEKKTVVALIIEIENGRPCRKGIAKCAPNDVFNASIGRAIALRRALGLEVPVEYLTVPSPTEVRVGDIVEWSYEGETNRKEVYTIVEVRTGKKRRSYDSKRHNKDEYVFDTLGFDFAETLIVLDDSRENNVTTSEEVAS